MAITSLVSSITRDTVYKSISAPNSSIAIVVDVDESNFTEMMANELIGIKFDVCVMKGSEHISVLNKGCLWNMKSDRTFSIINVPKSAYLMIEPILDDHFTDTYPDETPHSEFNISVSYENTYGTSGGGGGGGGSTTTYTDTDGQGNIVIESDDTTTTYSDDDGGIDITE